MDLRSILALATVSVSPLATADELVDIGPALGAGFSVASSRNPRGGDFAARTTCRLRNGGGVRISIEAGEQLSRTNPDVRWQRFWDAVQNPPNVIPDHFGSNRLGERSYYVDGEGFGGYRVFALLGKASIDVRLDLVARRESGGMVYEPHDVASDKLVVRQVAARTLANIAARELEDASADPATGAGRYSRPDGVRFVELTPWAKARGYSARLNDDGISVTLAKAERSVLVNLASKDAMVDGAKRTLSECPLWKEGRFLVAEKDLAKLF